MLTYFFLALLFAVIVWRIVLPGMNLAYDKTPATGTPTVPTPPARDWKVLFKKYHVWSIVLAVVGAGIFWKLYTPGLRFSQVGDWSWENWLWLLAFWGVLIALIALNTKALGTWAKTLQSATAVAMFLMFLGVPAVLWVRDVFLPAVVCDPIKTDGRKQSCILNTAWNKSFTVRAGEESVAAGKNLCVSPASMLEIERVVNNSGTFWKARAKRDSVVMIYWMTESCARRS